MNAVIGAIAGDIIGSVYEHHNIKTKEFILFSDESNYTDDTIMTVAVADWLVNTDKSESELVETIIRYAKKYPCPMGGYGGMFKKWLEKEGKSGPYGSLGNGSAMRVSAVGCYFDLFSLTNEYAEISAKITHNHEEGIKGAKALASIIYLIRNKYNKISIRDYVNNVPYKIEENIDRLRAKYEWDETCPGSVPQAISCFLAGNDYEDCIRNAISIGGDSDTIACMTGAMAGAYYGVPDYIMSKTLSLIPEDFINIINKLMLSWKRSIS